MRIPTVILVALLAGCATPQAPEVSIAYELDKNAVAVPVVNGKAYPMTEADRRKQVQLIVDEYCRAD